MENINLAESDHTMKETSSSHVLNGVSGIRGLVRQGLTWRPLDIPAKRHVYEPSIRHRHQDPVDNEYGVSKHNDCCDSLIDVSCCCPDAKLDANMQEQALPKSSSSINEGSQVTQSRLLKVIGTKTNYSQKEIEEES